MRIEGTYRSIGFSAREHVRDQLLDFWDTSGSTDKNDLVNRALVDLGVAEDLLDGIHGGAEEVLAKLLEPGTRDRGVEVNAVEEGVDFDGGLCGGGQGSLCPLAGGSETTKSTGVRGEVCTKSN